jgi:hypothetical protein
LFFMLACKANDLDSPSSLPLIGYSAVAIAFGRNQKCLP